MQHHRYTSRRARLAFAAVAMTTSAIAIADVTIGAVAPLTGPRAQLGRYFKQGVELAVAEVNAQGGVLGQPLRVVFEDDQGDNPNSAMNAVNRLMSVSKVPVFIGPHYSVAQMATQKNYCDGSVISVTGASGMAVTNSGCDYVIRVRANDNLQARALVTFIRDELKTEKIGLLYVNDDFGKAGAQRVAAAMEADGFKPVAMEAHNAQDKDFSAQLGRLKSAGAEVIVLWTHETEAALVVRQARQMGLDLPIAGAALSQPTFLRLTQGASNGVLSADDFVVSNDAPRVSSFVEAYKQKYGAEPEIWAAAYYDAAHIAAAAINRAGTLDVAKVRDAFNGLDYTGVLATFRCEPAGDCNHQSQIVEIQDGKPTLRKTVSF